MESHTERILITGALGQIGTELCIRLAAIYGKENIFGLGLEDEGKAVDSAAGTYVKMDVTDSASIEKFVAEHKITTV
ncbi:NAD-dependent epimerase/dehydratase family protein, partial [Elizabethkingia anophelis]|nr:NAD-dependent epimerase/dehydratase family protein [Elizabethkingia anophelis]